MRRIIAARMVSTAALALMTSAVNAAEIPWVKTFDSAVAQAKKTNKLVMADFYTDW